MEQIAVSFTTGGSPATGLTPIVNIWEKNGTKRATDGVCKEIAGGWYIYDFDSYSSDKIYLYQFDGTDTLSTLDRYKYGGNELDAYSNKYSRGRTAAPITNYMPNFQTLEKRLSELPVYNDTDIKKAINEIKGEITGKGGYDVYDKLDKLGSEIAVLQSTISGSKTPESFTKVDTAINNLNNSIGEMKNTLKSDMMEIEGMLGKKISGVGSKLELVGNGITENFTKNFPKDMFNGPVKQLEQKIEELVKGVMSEKLPAELMDSFEVSFSRKGAGHEALKKLAQQI